MSKRLVFGEDAPAPVREEPRPERPRLVNTYPPFDLEGRPRCAECGAIAIRDGCHECRDCRDVRLAEQEGTWT